MLKVASLLALAMVCGLAGCQPVTVNKVYTETYTDPQSGKTITYKETITQVPEELPAIHLKNADLYK